MADKKIPLNFDVEIYGNLEPYSPTISKSRVRVFYRGRNRNWSYISDEFAEKLVASLPYAPVKGIYDENEENYTDHGSGPRALGKAYGVVPERNNGAWERHIDPDGIERTYYCCDVLLWTALYENAKKIPGKCQSMELYEPSIKGEWRTFEDGFAAYEFTDGCFLGLQVLGTIDGEKVEPCFEGSAFYSLSKDLSEQFSDIIKVAKDYNLKKEDTSMEDINQTPVVEPVPEPAAEPVAEPVVEEPVVEEPTAEPVVTEEPAAESVVEPATEEPTAEPVVAEPVTESAAEPVEESFEVKYNEAVQKITELEAKYAELLSEKNVLQDNFNHLKAERDNLKEFKENTETAEKEEVLNKYSVMLSEEILNSYKEKLSEFTAIELDKELCFEAHKNDTFDTQTANFSYKGESPEQLSQLERYLNKYKTEE